MSNNGDKYGKTNFNSFGELTKMLSTLRVPAIKTKEQAWSEFESQLVGRNKVVAKRSLRYLTYYAITAGIALLISISYKLYINTETKVFCPPAQMITVFLPDSSQVILNAVSLVKFNKSSWSKERMIRLEGEAFFRVKKGSRFTVETENGNITVLGTTFNVFARNNRLEVYCETGKVSVASVNTVLLTPGMKAKANKGSALRVTNAELKNEASWQHGDFWFNNTPLTEVLAEIERQFDVSVQYNNLANRFYTGYFNRRSLLEALSTVLYPMQLDFKIENKIVQIIN